MVHTLPGRSNMLLGLPHRLQSGLELFPRQLPHGRYHTQPLRKLQLIELQHGSPPRSDLPGVPPVEKRPRGSATFPPTAATRGGTPTRPDAVGSLSGLPDH
jgi:hypothetical protein